MSTRGRQLRVPDRYELTRVVTPEYPWVPVTMIGICFGGAYLIAGRPPSVPLGPAVLGLLVGLTVFSAASHEWLHVISYRVAGVTTPVTWHRFAVVPHDATVKRDTLLAVTIVPTLVVGCALVIWYLLFDPTGLATVALSYVGLLAVVLAVPDAAGVLALMRVPSTAQVGYHVGEEFQILVFEESRI